MGSHIQYDNLATNGQYLGSSAPAKQHPEVNTLLVIALVTLIFCPILSPIAWFKGKRVVQEIDAAKGALTGRETANIARILGMIGSFMVYGVLLLVLVVLLVIGIVFLVSHGINAIFG